MELPSEHVLSKIFDQADKSGDGSLSLDDVEVAAKAIWPSFEDKVATAVAYKAADLNSSNTIQRNEFTFFLRFLCNYNNLWKRVASSLQVAAEKSQSKCDHHFTKAEFTVTIQQDLLPAYITSIDEAFSEIDFKKRGYVSYREICMFLTMHQTKKTASPGGCYRIANSTSSKLLAAALESYGDKDYSYVGTLFIRLRCSIDVLQGRANDSEIEKCAVLINECLSLETRHSLSVKRHFMESDMVDPFQMIAFLFYEVVYYELDKVSPVLVELLEDIYEESGDGTIRLKFVNCPNIKMVMSIFGLKFGDKIAPRRPFDRFLSSIVAVRSLKNCLSMPNLLKIVVTIYGTIFPYKNVENIASTGHLVVAMEKNSKLNEKLEHTIAKENVASDLYERLVGVNKTYDLGLAEGKLVKAIQRAVDACNRSYGSFCSNDPKDLIVRMWAKLPEMTPALRRRKLFTAFDYHQGIKIIENSLDNLKPQNLFLSFRGAPTASEIAILQQKADTNLNITRTYIKAKALFLAIIAAFAKLTGGDAPISYFIGDAPTNQIGGGLPDLSADGPFNSLVAADCNMDVYQTLLKGRPTDSWYVRKSSKIGAYLYGRLGDKMLHRVLDHTTFPMDDGQAKDLFSSLPTDLILPIGKEIAKIAVGRCKDIEMLLKELLENSSTTAI